MNEGRRSWADRILGRAAVGDLPGLSWLDGGPHGRSVVGLVPTEDVRADSLAALDGLPPGYWIGWLTYEAGVDALLGRPARPRTLPGVCMRRFDGLLAWDSSGTTSLGDATSVDAIIADLMVERASPRFDAWPLQPLRAGLDPAEYRRRVEVVLDEIRAGNAYQVNLSQPFRGQFTDAARTDSWSRRVAALYSMLRSGTPAPMGGLVFDGPRALISNSPETLMHWRAGHVQSSPIKGTRARGSTPEQDQKLAAALLASGKDAAEHVMIVDLVRNDLGRIAKPGTVTAPRRPTLVTLPTVHHLVSEVRAEVGAGTRMGTLLAALFPGGSITGAPKIASVDIIERLERAPRGLYCGGFVLVTPTEVTVSIAIRSGVCDDEGLTVHGGGGIVLDSDPEDERLESVAKVRAFDRAAQPGHV